jgi:NAD(P)-dependent dehydrogenase (short-subunit alcohol dehydrogenase family)
MDSGGADLMARTIVVTGAASGIGAAATRLLRAAGHEVIGMDRAPSALASSSIEVDLADPESIRGAADAVDRPIDALANVAGVSGSAGADLTLRVNFLGLRALTEALQPKLGSSGSVVNVASFAGEAWRLREKEHLALASTRSFDEGLAWLRHHQVSDDFAYPYSKEVLRVWTRVQAAHWIGRGPRMNVVNPGPVETPILGEFRATLGEERVSDDISRAGRAGSPDEIAEVIVWLCATESSWVNGAEIAVDGGLAASFSGGDR